MRRDSRPAAEPAVASGRTPERIEDIELLRLAFPLPHPFRAAIRLIDSVDILLVRVRAGGAVGHGYAFAFGAADLAPVLSVAQGLRELLLGRDALHTERRWAEMHQALALSGAGGPALAALSAIDIALWDLLGQVAGLPLHVLLGGARDRVSVYGSGGSLQLDSDGLVAEAQAFAAQGYRAFKFKAGHGMVEDAARLAALRQALGPEFRLIVDGNQQWSYKDALRAAQMFEPHDIWWLEEPLVAHDVAGYARLRAAVPCKIATGETNFGVPECARLVREQATDILMPNLQRAGGITGWCKVAAMAELHGVPMASHVYTEIGVHLMCGVPNGLTLEVLPWWPKLFGGTLHVEDGHAVPPSAPGIGLALDPDVLAAYGCH